jgi:hypothetical protein
MYTFSTEVVNTLRKLRKGENAYLYGHLRIKFLESLCAIGNVRYNDDHLRDTIDSKFDNKRLECICNLVDTMIDTINRPISLQFIDTYNRVLLNYLTPTEKASIESWFVDDKTIQKLISLYNSMEHGIEEVIAFTASYILVNRNVDSARIIGTIILFRESLLKGLDPILIPGYVRTDFELGIKRAATGDITILTSLAEIGQDKFKEFYNNAIEAFA